MSGALLYKDKISPVPRRPFEAGGPEGPHPPEISAWLQSIDSHRCPGSGEPLLDQIEEPLITSDLQSVGLRSRDRSPAKHAIENGGAEDLLRLGAQELARGRREGLQSSQVTVSPGEDPAVSRHQLGPVAGQKLHRALENLQPSGLPGLDFEPKVRAANDGACRAGLDDEVA